MTDEEPTQEEMWADLEENLNPEVFAMVQEHYQGAVENAPQLLRSDFEFMLGVANSRYRIEAEDAARVLRDVADHLEEYGYSPWRWADE